MADYLDYNNEDFTETTPMNNVAPVLASTHLPPNSTLKLPSYVPVWPYAEPANQMFLAVVVVVVAVGLARITNR